MNVYFGAQAVVNFYLITAFLWVIFTFSSASDVWFLRNASKNQHKKLSYLVTVLQIKSLTLMLVFGFGWYLFSPFAAEIDVISSLHREIVILAIIVIISSCLTTVKNLLISGEKHFKVAQVNFFTAISGISSLVFAWATQATFQGYLLAWSFCLLSLFMYSAAQNTKIFLAATPHVLRRINRSTIQSLTPYIALNIFSQIKNNFLLLAVAVTTEEEIAGSLIIIKRIGDTAHKGLANFADQYMVKIMAAFDTKSLLQKLNFQAFAFRIMSAIVLFMGLLGYSHIATNLNTQQIWQVSFIVTLFFVGGYFLTYLNYLTFADKQNWMVFNSVWYSLVTVVITSLTAILNQPIAMLNSSNLAIIFTMIPFFLHRSFNTKMLITRASFFWYTSVALFIFAYILR